MAETYVEREHVAHGERPMVSKGISRLSWGGIIAGAVVTIAVGLLLNALWAAIGLTAVGEQPGSWGVGSGWWTGIWSLVTIAVATFIGAMVGTRASTVHRRSDGAGQGLTVWALSLLLMLVLTGFMAMSMVGMTTRIAGSALQAAGAAAEAGATELSRQELGQLQQQAQQALPSGQAAGARLEQAGEQAATAGAVVAWWFFISAVFGAVAGILGGVVGVPKRRQEERVEVRRTRPLTPRETTT